MKNIFCVSDNGDLYTEQFDTREEANDFIDENFDDDDKYLVKVFEMTSSEHNGRLSLQDLFTNPESIEKAIQLSGEDEKLYKYLADASSAAGGEWIKKMYSDHFKFALLEGGYAYEEAFEEVKLMSFNEFLNYLRKEIDFAEDYDAALLKHNS